MVTVKYCNQTGLKVNPNCVFIHHLWSISDNRGSDINMTISFPFIYSLGPFITNCLSENPSDSLTFAM